MAINNLKLLKNATLSLIYLTCVTNTYSMNPNMENINNIINNSSNTVNSQSLQNISNNNNNNSNGINRPIFIGNRTDDNSNNTSLLCTKTQRSNKVTQNKTKRKSKNNVTFRYNDFRRANKTLKNLMEQKKIRLQQEYNDGSNNLSPIEKKSYEDEINKLSELCKNNVTVLNPNCLNLINNETKDYFNLKYIIKQIKLLNSKIKRKIGSNNCNEFNNIFSQINNDHKMDKTLYNKLVNMGLIKQDKFYIHLYESAKQIETVKKQQELNEIFYKIYNNIDTFDRNKTINNFELFYKTIINLNNIDAIFTHHSDIAEIIQKNLISNINNILNNNIAHKLMPFGIERTILTFNIMRERFIDGSEVQMDFVKGYTSNVEEFIRYYRDMLYKSDIFTTIIEEELHNIDESSINLSKYYNDITSVDMKLFLNDNKKAIEDTMRKMRSDWKDIFNQTWRTQLNNINNVTELLKEIRNKINNGNEFEKKDSSLAFLVQVMDHFQKIKNDINNYQIIKDIFSNEYFKKIAMNELMVKQIFKKAYIEIRKLIQNGKIHGNNIQNEYCKYIFEHTSSDCKTVARKLRNIGNTVDIELPKGLKEILSCYISDLNKFANIEYRKYIYASKFIIDIDKAIVPAGFWGNSKLIK